MRVACRIADIDGRNSFAHQLNVGGIREAAGMSAALDRYADTACGLHKMVEQRGMSKRTIERTAPVETVEAKRRAAAKSEFTTLRKIGRIGGDHDVDRNGGIWPQALGRKHGAAQVELLLDRKHRMQRGGSGFIQKPLHKVHQRGTAGPVVDRR